MCKNTHSTITILFVDFGSVAALTDKRAREIVNFNPAGI